MANAARITETELILPSLYLMSLNGGSITTAELIPKLRQIMKPSEEDLIILARRNDDRFSQKVRNLKAHDTFERFGYAAYNKGIVTINNRGCEHLEQNRHILKYLLINDFAYSDLAENLRSIEAQPDRKIETFDENIFIQEGMKKITEGMIYTRSKQLRDYALDYFTIDGRISCESCTFNFADFYGEVIGNNFIEIHHVKPIFQYEGGQIIQTLQGAVENLVPVCSNCHRMIHRNWSKPLELATLIGGIENNGVFKRFSQAV